MIKSKFFLLVAHLIIQPASIFAEGDYSGWHYMDHPMMGGYWGMGWILIIFVILAVAILYFKPGQKEGKSAIDILKERYARGEIDKDEYESKKKDLI